jgi:hypothetical protein
MILVSQEYNFSNGLKNPTDNQLGSSIRWKFFKLFGGGSSVL